MLGLLLAGVTAWHTPQMKTETLRSCTNAGAGVTGPGRESSKGHTAGPSRAEAQLLGAVHNRTLCSSDPLGDGIGTDHPPRAT
jgi:hypothetical protein